ncbi:MAG: hypothetical protein ATN36_08245 [Epulopiscium sp. Nele67-Bin005]|nr:MAG: hypothetical protein ATN36_08245 [Epulopiscium sp. Nele67-Bin005]
MKKLLGVSLLGLGMLAISQNSLFADSSEYLSSFNNIKVESDAIELKISRGEEFYIDIEVPKKEGKFSYEVKNDTLYIEHEFPFNKKYFSWFAGSSDNYIYNVEIFIPEDVDLNEIDIEANIGAVGIYDLSIDTLKINSTMSAVELEENVLKNIDIDTTMGAVKIVGTLNGTTNIDTTMGAISISGNLYGYTNIDTNMGAVDIVGNLNGSTDIDTTMGAISIAGNLNGDTNIDANMGAIIIETPQSEHEFNYTLKSSTPAILLNNQSLGTSYQTKDTNLSSNLNISVTLGSIEIYTK